MQMEFNRIKDIAAFIAVVNAGSYTKATHILGLSRSAIGKSIIRLESQLGVRLLNRSPRQLSLTDEGAVMYERCQQILEDLEEVNTVMAVRRERPTGTLKLTAPLSLGQKHIRPLVERFLNKWPELTAEIIFSDRYVDLIEEGFDIAIRVGEPKHDSRVLTKTVANQHMITCASPLYLKQHGEPTSPQELKDHQAIFFRNAERRKSWHYKTPEGEYIHDGPSRMDIDSSEAMISSAIEGFGIVYLPEYLLYEPIDRKELIPILTEFPTQIEPIRIMYPSKRYLSPRIRKFIDLIIEEWQQKDIPWKKANKRL